MAQNAFFELVIGNRTFTGVMSADGPYISCHSTYSGTTGVALGHATSIVQVVDSQGERNWWIVKYDNQLRVDLRGLAFPDVQGLAAAFAIPIRGEARPDFFSSDAFHHLVKWVKAHPRIAKRHSQHGYIPGWYERASETKADPTAAAVH